MEVVVVVASGLGAGVGIGLAATFGLRLRRRVVRVQRVRVVYFMVMTVDSGLPVEAGCKEENEVEVGGVARAETAKHRSLSLKSPAEDTPFYTHYYYSKSP